MTLLVYHRISLLMILASLSESYSLPSTPKAKYNYWYSFQD
ncbi:hypothetical protein NC652_014333 [Populus alba x Populus x berolinensis]|nr:hypothetical protein NC652_014333 [Populus alba x Populus x berolinensis]